MTTKRGLWICGVALLACSARNLHNSASLSRPTGRAIVVEVTQGGRIPFVRGFSWRGWLECPRAPLRSNEDASTRVDAVTSGANAREVSFFLTHTEGLASSTPLVIPRPQECIHGAVEVYVELFPLNAPECAPTVACYGSVRDTGGVINCPLPCGTVSRPRLNTGTFTSPLMDAGRSALDAQVDASRDGYRDVLANPDRGVMDAQVDASRDSLRDALADQTSLRTDTRSVE